MSGPQRILVLARTVSILGNFAAPVALSFAVLALAPGPEAAPRLALVLAAAAVPQLLFLAVGGVAADRGHRRLLAVGGETGAGLAEAASAVLLLTHTATVGALAGLAAARGAFSAAGTPAMRAFVADLADRTDQIASASAALSGGRAIATIAGPALGGFLVTCAGPGWALAVNAASYVTAAVLLSPLRSPARSARAAGSRPASARQLRNGWRAIAHSAWLWPLMLYGMLFVLLVDGPSQLISPLLSRQHYGGAIALAISTTAFGVGSVVGSSIAWRIRPQRPLLVYIALYFLEIPLRLAWVILPPLPVLAVSAGMAGLSFSAASSLWQTVLATRIASQQLGIVAAADEAGSAVANPLAIALTAPLIAVLGARTIMAGGLLWLAASTTALTALTTIRDPGRADFLGTDEAAGDTLVDHEIGNVL
ncbi:MAG TPA: MFS transporter [Streptosporangiaceae bacterium]|nr:MFS transporter [Streptosporangiaceae bacterium]